MIKKILSTLLCVFISISVLTDNVYAEVKYKDVISLDPDSLNVNLKGYLTSLTIDTSNNFVFMNNVNVGVLTSDPQTFTLYGADYNIIATVSPSALTCNATVKLLSTESFTAAFNFDIENNQYYVCYFYPEYNNDTSSYEKQQSTRNGDIHNFTFSHTYGEEYKTFNVQLVQSTGEVLINGDSKGTLSKSNYNIIFEFGPTSYQETEYPIKNIDYMNDLKPLKWSIAKANTPVYGREFKGIPFKQEYDLTSDYLNLPKVVTSFGDTVNEYHRVEGTSTTGTGVWQATGNTIEVVCEWTENNQCGEKIRSKLPRYWIVQASELSSTNPVIKVNQQIYEAIDEYKNYHYDTLSWTQTDMFPSPYSNKWIQVSTRTASWSSWSSWTTSKWPNSACSAGNCKSENEARYSNYTYTGNPANVTSWTDQCTGPSWVQNSQCGSQYKTCTTSACGYNKCQTAACGVASYKSCATSACGVESYKTCKTSACGALVCATSACGVKTCATSACGVKSYKTCQSSAFGYQTCNNAACGAKSCATSACGCAKKVAGICIKYNTCKNAACGYNSCATSACGAKVGTGAACGVKEYNTCASSACGYKTCQNAACGYMTCDNPACGANYKTCQAVACGVKSYVSCIHEDCGAKTCQTSACGTEYLHCYLYSCPATRTIYYRYQTRSWSDWSSWITTSAEVSTNIDKEAKYRYKYPITSWDKEKGYSFMTENSKGYWSGEQRKDTWEYVTHTVARQGGSKSYNNMPLQTESMVEGFQSEYAMDASGSQILSNMLTQVDMSDKRTKYVDWDEYETKVKSSPTYSDNLRSVQEKEIYQPYLYFAFYRYLTDSVDLPSGTKSKNINAKVATSHSSGGVLVKNTVRASRDTKVIYYDYQDPLTNYHDELPENWKGYESLIEEIKNSDLSSYKISVKLSDKDLDDMREWLENGGYDKLGTCAMLREFSYIFVGLDGDLASWFASGNSCKIGDQL